MTGALLVLHVVPNRQSRGACWLPQRQCLREVARRVRVRRPAWPRWPTPFSGWFFMLCFSFRDAGFPGAETAASSRGWNDIPGREGRRRVGSPNPRPAPVPRTRAMPHPCPTRGRTGHRQAPGARAADGSLMGLPALGTHLRQGPPVHVGTAQVDVPSVHDPEFGVQNAPSELPQGHEPHLGTWPGGEDRAVTGVSPGVRFTVSPIPRGGTACLPSEQSC